MMKDRNTKYRFLHDSIVKIYKTKGAKKAWILAILKPVKKKIDFQTLALVSVDPQYLFKQMVLPVISL